MEVAAVKKIARITASNASSLVVFPRPVVFPMAFAANAWSFPMNSAYLYCRVSLWKRRIKTLMLYRNLLNSTSHTGRCESMSSTLFSENTSRGSKGKLHGCISGFSSFTIRLVRTLNSQFAPVGSYIVSSDHQACHRIHHQDRDSPEDCLNL